MDTGFFKAVSGFKFTSRKHRISDDDAIDRINSFYAPVLIVIMSSIVMAKMYLLGDPVQCWIPPEFKPAWEQYAETYCWLKNTYFVPLNASIPSGAADRQKEELSYYQWVPFVLAAQAMLFYLPSLIWKLLNWQSGVQIKSLVAMAVGSLEEDPDDKSREEKIADLAWHFEVSIVKKASRKSGFFYGLKTVLVKFLLFGKSKSGSYLTCVYLLVKALYIANVIGQFFLLNSFLSTDYNFFGLGVLHDLWYHQDWRHSGHFPRVTLCDFNVRTIGNTQARTLQCVLVVNLLNEKIFIFLWFLLLIVAVVTILDALFWLVWALVPSRRFARLKMLLATWRPQDSAASAAAVAAATVASLEGRPLKRGNLMRKFLNSHLQADGAFVLRLIGKNAGEPVLRTLVHRLWLNYQLSEIKAKEAEESKQREVAARNGEA